MAGGQTVRDMACVVLEEFNQLHVGDCVGRESMGRVSVAISVNRQVVKI